MSTTSLNRVLLPAREERAAARPPGRLDAVDGLRALAAVSVLLYHVCRATGATQTGPLAPLISELKAGVTVFFVISGFLLYLPYARAIRAGAELPDWRDFAQRRAVRILPAYWVALSILAFGPLHSMVLGPGWWRFYTFSQIYDTTTTLGGLGVAWSLCVEVSFYLVLPIFAVAVAQLVLRHHGEPAVVQLRVIGLCALACLGLRAALAGSLISPIGDVVTPGGSHSELATSLPGLLDWFALGLALAVLRSEWERGAGGLRWLAALARRPGPCWLGAAAFYAVGVPMQQRNAFLALYGLGTHLAIGLAAFMFVLPAIVPPVAGRPFGGAGSRSGPIALLTHPGMVWLGTISYGVYLWHKPVLDALNGPLPNVAARPFGLASIGLFVVTLAGGVALGAASWYLVERPIQRRVRARARAVAATG